jgi:molybdopterin-guanine dinucleotide biosynthesis protein A
MKTRSRRSASKSIVFEGNPVNSFDGIILAGGGNTRIGYNKALLPIGGVTIIEKVISAMKPLVDKVIVVSKRQDGIDPTRFLRDYTGVEVVYEDCQVRNPLVGIYTGLTYSNSDYSLILPCDAPFVNPGVLKHLLDICLGFDLTIPRWSNGYLEPLCAVYRGSSILSLISDPMEIGSHSIRYFIARLPKVRYVPVEELRRFDRSLLTFFNINTLQEYEEALKLSKSLMGDLSPG